ncbi:hypothetical protein [uncultured Oxalicibacterium sp.]|uniref:type IV pilus assembly protein FimV n=1 Tax=uncultured Oxalicibacterium sp. TaxID=1168540 RepID=UPI0025EFB96E|nr:hypothetical protein [uncultured Oxalicibacterium sp.]
MMNCIGRVFVYAAAVCSTLLWSGAACAWGFGEMRVQSALGEPFRTQINLIGSDIGNAEKSCFKAGLRGFDGMVLGTATVTFRENSHVLLITTRTPVNEPAASLTVSYTCAPPMQREYAILLDLPAAQPANERRAQAAAPSSSTDSFESVAPAPSVKKSRRHAQPVTEETSSDSPSTDKVVNAPSNSKRKESAREVKKAEQTRSVLKLGRDEAATDGHVFRQRLALSYSLASPPVDPESVNQATIADATQESVSASDQALRQLLEKIHALERRTEALQKLNAEQSTALDAARKAQTPASSMYILYGLLLACAVAIGWLVWRMRQIRSEVGDASWQQMVPEVDAVPSVSSVAEIGPQSDAATTDSSVEREDGQRARSTVFSSLARMRKSKARQDEPKVVTAPVPASRDDSADNDYRVDRRNIANAEEILDEIQEAEFWVHMNQPQRAIAILETEVQPASPLKWLHLVDLYRMVGEQEKYEALAIRFKDIFNGRIAPWGLPESAGGARDIEAFPQVLEKIMAVWQTDGAIALLEKLLVDDREGSREGFDLPAYRDLLFLTNLAYQVQALRNAEGKELAPLDWPFPDEEASDGVKS